MCIILIQIFMETGYQKKYDASNEIEKTFKEIIALKDESSESKEK